ncbi:hypothetical protein JHK82_031817 [Glycine max]|nr:hypothetical protein JHK85_032475 [Glycine max]KAG4995083.1 hypothetical protein JHK86_031910 [Glycine max]KAG5125080.1 hypothetical protein JHK82_031817 [Glycine max]KAG5146506.1 hypothetical protein JHK84_032049 [Glycine max]
MGTQDGFTSVKQLRNKLTFAAGCVETHLIDGVGHFQMERPGYDAEMVDLIIKLEYILPLLILGDGFFQYGVSLWTEYASKALGTIIS